VSGPGYLNFVASDSWLADQVGEMAAAPVLVSRAARPERFVVDYSSPNVAKEMHVGHLRTTVVGDALVRLLEAKGHSVVRQNHIGDWGTPFGMLVEYLEEVGKDSPAARAIVSDPNGFYQSARARFDEDADFTTRARARVVKLQSGDEATLATWRWLVDRAKDYFGEIYAALDITLRDGDVAGESSYNDDLEAVCEDLVRMGLAQVSDGALCVFPDGFTNRDGERAPLIVRKSDGGYGYATTDLAAIRRRVGTLRADHVLYVVGAPQSTHFQMVFAVARSAGWLPESVTAEHVAIGNVLGSDGKILRTRSGDSPKLLSLVEEAVVRAEKIVSDGARELGDVSLASIAHDVGVGAVKFADLAVSHDAEYVFDLDRMTSLQEATGPYVQYATTRARALEARAAAVGIVPAEHPTIEAGDARALAVQLLELDAVVDQTVTTRSPHVLCRYLLGLASSFNSFYASSRVVGEPEDVAASRLMLVALTRRVLTEGLGLLGVRVPLAM
jgi:arginyl-tRNA synthetase